MHLYSFLVVLNRFDRQKKMPGFELFGGSRLAFFKIEIRRIKGVVNPTYKCDRIDSSETAKLSIY
jgi:hypothetical protein